MIYTVERANLISEQLRKFTDSYAHMVAGQFANIDFWIDEVINSVRAIDEHSMRFEKMCEAQIKWIEEKEVRVPNYCHICNGICELSEQHYKKPELPKNRSKGEKKESRKKLVDSTYYFLIRCFKIGLLNEEELKIYCNKIGISVDLYDLKK
ncbi:MAG: hypothetical protein HRU40_18165 [Saprospiraceae bacterium]|nr:hypothetical protein [Saprospiraceae bacterium]